MPSENHNHRASSRSHGSRSHGGIGNSGVTLDDSRQSAAYKKLHIVPHADE
jgi:hypothetical protein